jgi:hypothetical protein
MLKSSSRKFQIELARFNSRRLLPALPSSDWINEQIETGRMLRDEGIFLEEQRSEISDRAKEAPTERLKFMEWFEELTISGPGQGDSLFDWLEYECSLEQMKWFLTQEVSGEAGFDDLTALTQVKFPTQCKLELARNFWDEMGRGNSKAIHGRLLDTIVHSLQLTPSIDSAELEPLVLANVMVGLAANRRFAFHSIGALGAIEMTAPQRSAATAAGLKRLGISTKDRHYFELHAVLDVKHSASWNREVIIPLISENVNFAHAIAEGALMRLSCGANCFARYKKKFGLVS